MDTRNLTSKIASLMKSEKLSDVSLIVGKKPEKKCFNVHKVILSLFSEVFEAMFYGKLANSEKEILLPEDDPDSFVTIIRYIYSGELALESQQNTIDLLLLADKYCVLEIKRKCVDYLSKNISSDLVISMYEMAFRMNEQGMRLQCWKHILYHTSEVLIHKSFRDASVSTVTSIMAQHYMNIKSEVELYNAIVRWGRYQREKKGLVASESNIRMEIEGLLGHIKFMSMTPECFASGPAMDGILNQEEKLILLQNIIKPGIIPLASLFNPDRAKRNNLLPGKSLSINYQQCREISNVFLEGYPYFKKKVRFTFYDVYIYGVKAYLSSMKDKCFLADVKCSLSITNVNRRYNVERKNLVLLAEGDDFVIETDDPVYVACGEVCDIELTIYYSQQHAFVCSGNCKASSNVTVENNCKMFDDIDKCRFHLHGILMWHIYRG